MSAEQIVIIVVALVAPGGVIVAVAGRWLDNRQAARTALVHDEVTARIGTPNGHGDVTQMLTTALEDLAEIKRRGERMEDQQLDLSGRVTRVERRQGSCAHELHQFSDQLAGLDTRLQAVETDMRHRTELDQLAREGRLHRRADDPLSIDDDPDRT